MKKFVIALIAFAFVITLAGCGGGGGGSPVFILNRGDNGAALKNYGNGKDLTPVKTAYTNINTVFKDNSTPDKDPDGTIRANALKEYISDAYTGRSDYSSDVSTKDKLIKRLTQLIHDKKFEGLEIIPFATNDGATATTVTEKTKLYVAKFIHSGNTYLNKEYVFNEVKWVKEESGWKIRSGFDELGKSASELANQ